MKILKKSSKQSSDDSVYTLRFSWPKNYKKLFFLAALLLIGIECISFSFYNPDIFFNMLYNTAASNVQVESQGAYPLQTSPPYTVALDAGHGGTDTGAQTSSIDEEKACLATTNALYELLEKDENYTPVKTRPDDKDPSNESRVEVATNNQASLLISIHANCDPGNRQSHGFECYPTPPGRKYSAQSYEFAQYVVEGMRQSGHRIRGKNGIRYAYYSGQSKRIVEGDDTKVRSLKSFGMVEKPQCPAVLVEQGFITNYSDAENWISQEGCNRAALIYYNAICKYFGTQPMVTPSQTPQPSPQA